MVFLPNSLVETTLIDRWGLLHVARLDNLETGQSVLSVNRSLGLDPNHEWLKPFQHIIDTAPFQREQIIDLSMKTGWAELTVYEVPQPITPDSP